MELHQLCPNAVFLGMIMNTILAREHHANAFDDLPKDSGCVLERIHPGLGDESSEAVCNLVWG